MYTNSKYTFYMFLTHMTTWNEKGFLNIKENSIMNSSCIYNHHHNPHLPEYLFTLPN